MDSVEIMGCLPHRYPFLLVDRVLECVPGEYMKAAKNVTFNEPFFQGHFPGQPVLPGVLIIEALAQTTGILASQTEGETLGDDSLYYLVGIDKARFKRPVGPGETLILEVRLLRVRRQVWAFDATATVDEKVVASAELMCAKRAVKEVHS